MLRYMTDRVRPGLVTFYDIWPGNGAGLFSEPRNLHKANKMIEAVLIPALQQLWQEVRSHQVTEFC